MITDWPTVESLPGVRIMGIRPEMVDAHVTIASVFAKHGYSCITTHAVDGVHGSVIHYVGCGRDYRTKHLKPADKKAVLDDIRACLSDEFQAVLEFEGEDNEHMHVEFDPKGGGARE